MSRRPPAKVRNPADAAKLIFVLTLLLAFGMRRGLAEGKAQLPWLGGVLLALIVLSGGFLLVTTVLHHRRHRNAEDDSEDDPAGPSAK